MWTLIHGACYGLRVVAARSFCVVALLSAFSFAACSDVKPAIDGGAMRDTSPDTGLAFETGDESDAGPRLGRGPVAVSGGGSHQNPCFSPDATRLVFTIWRGGYNVAPAVVADVSINGGAPIVLTEEGAVSVNLPGSCWNARTRRITFSTDAFDDRDEIYTIGAGGGDLERVTNRPGFVAFEPSFSPDGEWIVFESHVVDVGGGGAIHKVRPDGTELTLLTDGSGDDRQPNWSPIGDRILFQSHERGREGIDIYVMDTAGESIRNVTQSPFSDTDASFSPDGSRIVYSSDREGAAFANLYVIPVEGGNPTRLTSGDSYDGAPSWSPDGTLIAFESVNGEPDGSTGTHLRLVAAPD